MDFCARHGFLSVDDFNKFASWNSVVASIKLWIPTFSAWIVSMEKGIPLEEPILPSFLAKYVIEKIVKSSEDFSCRIARNVMTAHIKNLEKMDDSCVDCATLKTIREDLDCFLESLLKCNPRWTTILNKR